MVAGADDIRVSVLEDYLLDRALHELNVPSGLLIFPGEGHSLAKNPWHGKIKVREELKWLTKYGGGAGTKEPAYWVGARLSPTSTAHSPRSTQGNPPRATMR